MVDWGLLFRPILLSHLKALGGVDPMLSDTSNDQVVIGPNPKLECNRFSAVAPRPRLRCFRPRTNRGVHGRGEGRRVL